MPGFESDRQLVERLFIPAMMSTVVSVMNRKVEEETGARLSEFDRALPLLTEAMAEPIKDLPPERCAKLIRRSKRLTEFAMKQFFELQLGLQYLIVAYWIIDLTDRDIITIGAESAFGKAWDILAETMSAAWHNLESLETEARQSARDLVSSLEAQGYFRPT